MTFTEYRTISLISHIIKIMLEFILTGTEEKINNDTGRMQGPLWNAGTIMETRLH